MKKDQKVWRKLTAVLGSVAIATSVLAGCGGDSSSPTARPTSAAGGSTAQPNATPEPPYSMSIMMTSFNPEVMDRNGEIYKTLEERTNTDLTMLWVPSSAYTDRLSATVASGELPTALLVLNQKLPYIVNSARSGMFWEVGPYLQDFPNLSRMNDIALNAISIDGKIYGLYRERDLARDGVMLREDWLDNLGLEVPETIEDFYDVLQAFTEGDPDRNNRNDTIGLAEQQVMAGWRTMLVWHGGPADWEIVDGQASPAHLSPAYMDTMNFYKSLYDGGYMNLDFAVVPDGKQLINGNRAGSWVANLNDAQGIDEAVKTAVPTGSITMTHALEGPAGLRAAGGSGSYGIFMIPKTTVKTEEELLKVLNFFDILSEEDMQNMLLNGIEGRQYTIEEGEYVKTTDPTMLVEYGMGDSSQLTVLRDRIQTFGGPLVHMRSEMWTKNAEIAIGNPVQPFISDTQSEIGSELTKIIEDARTQYIMGEIDEAGWEAAVQKWLQDGGSRVMDEYTEAYSATQ